MEPAAIRYKNPGAMWGRTGKRPGPEKVHNTNAKIPLKWGSKTTVYLNDGTGQGNNIAVFPTWVQGICAQLDLWRTSANYRNKRFADAIRVWSGGNNVPSYIAYVKARIPGMNENTVMNDAFWNSPMGVKFLQVQAGHEAGKPMPCPVADFVEAQRIVMGKAAPTTTTTKVTATAAATNTATIPGAVAAAQGGFPWVAVLVIAIGIAIPVLAAWWFNRKEQEQAQRIQDPAIQQQPIPGFDPQDFKGVNADGLE